jgi:hypothetical protein
MSGDDLGERKLKVDVNSNVKEYEADILVNVMRPLK